jgi:hypothetical protein
MNVPANRPDDEEPRGGKWGTIRYAIRSWGTTIRLLTVLPVMSAPIYLIVVHLINLLGHK